MPDPRPSTFTEEDREAMVLDALYVADEFIRSATTWNGCSDDQDDALASVQRAIELLDPRDHGGQR